MPTFDLPSRPSTTSSMPTGGGSAFPAELQMPAPSPEAIDSSEALLQRIRDFNASANQLDTQIVMNKQISESERVSTIIKALEILQSLGVNPSNPQSIAKYLMKLEEENPDMAEIAKQTLYGIFGGAPVESSSPSAVPMQEELQF